MITFTISYEGTLFLLDDVEPTLSRPKTIPLSHSIIKHHLLRNIVSYFFVVGDDKFNNYFNIFNSIILIFSVFQFLLNSFHFNVPFFLFA